MWGIMKEKEMDLCSKRNWLTHYTSVDTASFYVMNRRKDEMETYWLCCCDAAKYQFSEDAIKAIKVVNNQNLLSANYEVLANQKQADTLRKNIYNDNLWENMFDIEKEDPTKYNPPSDDVFKDFYDDENKETTNEV